MALFVLWSLGGCSKAEPTPSVQPQASANGIYINLDSKEKSLPSRFRKCDAKIDNKVGDRTVSLSGLKDLRMSGSGQFSAAGLMLLCEQINSGALYIVDLRQESHGFVNGIAISYMDKDNKANKAKTPSQVTADEAEKLQLIKSSGTITIQSLDSPIKVDTVLSEQEQAKSLGLSYIRFPVTNNEYPTDDVVDAFVQFAASLPKGAWLHMHCMEGVGRTTMFMVMYDSMKNAKAVSLEDIMDRQVLLGGKNLLQSGSDERANFIRSFYAYCKENSDGFKTSWSSFVQSKKK